MSPPKFQVNYFQKYLVSPPHQSLDWTISKKIWWAHPTKGQIELFLKTIFGEPAPPKFKLNDFKKISGEPTPPKFRLNYFKKNLVSPPHQSLNWIIS